MTDWWDKYLEDVDQDRLFELIPYRDAEEKEYICKLIVSCRLAFATVSGKDYPEALVPSEAIISETRIGASKGRPKTSRWAFWLAYLYREDHADAPPKHNILAELVGILLNRDITNDELRQVFVKLRSEAQDKAKKVAKRELVVYILPNLGPKKFERHVKRKCGELSEDDKKLLKDIINERTSLLNLIREKGILGDQKPAFQLSFDHHTFPTIRIVPRRSVRLDHERSGVVHLGKNYKTNISPSVLHSDSYSDRLSLQATLSKDNTNVRLGFPTDALNETNPLAATLAVFPKWWKVWDTLVKPLMKFDGL